VAGAVVVAAGADAVVAVASAAGRDEPPLEHAATRASVAVRRATRRMAAKATNRRYEPIVTGTSSTSSSSPLRWSAA
jgi:hypothetical protein